MAGYDDFSRQTTWVLGPEIEYVTFDGTSIQISYLAFNGPETTKFGAFSDSDIVYLLLKAFF